MDNIEKQFDDFVNDIRFDDVPSDDHRDKLERNLIVALDRQSRQERKTLKIWRIIMKSQITKLATAAVIIVAVVLSVSIFSNSNSTAWAIEQSIEAMNQYNAVVIEGLDMERTWKANGSLKQRPFKSWAVANECQTMVEKYRYEADGIPSLITNGKKTWRYDPNTNTVRIENRPYVASECWFGGQLFEQLKSFRELTVFTHWQQTYVKDPHSGRQQVLLKIAWLDGRFNGPRSIVIEIDVESKLLVGLKQWENADWEGIAALVVEKITYHENLPDELFEFKVPEGATVIEQE
jgi:outer membrane lipoprotein-sorting protein